MTQKKYLYKLITDNKGSTMSTTVNQLFKAFMSAPESETFKRGKPIIQNRAHLINIIEELEKENLVMYSCEDGNVVLIWVIILHKQCNTYKQDLRPDNY